MTLEPLVGQGHLVIEASHSHSDTAHSADHLWESDQPITESSNLQHSQEADMHVPGGIQTPNPSK